MMDMVPKNQIQTIWRADDARELLLEAMANTYTYLDIKN